MVGAQAEKLVRRCMEAVDAEKKVLSSFPYRRHLGRIPSPTLKVRKRPVRRKPRRPAARFISWIKVDGTTVYDAKEEAEKAQQSQGEPQGEPQPLLSTLNKPLLEHGLIEYRPS
ncbi:DUF3577 domain-containing protein [Pseudomonas aeruginosa]|nr:DUF3577 domain-containing protein [Pseudomonas aeruginosa]